MTIHMQPAPQEGLTIIGLESEHLDGSSVPWHRHDYAQLLYPAEGAVRVWAGDSVWQVHASSALWIPPGVAHRFIAAGKTVLKTVLVTQADAGAIGGQCFMTGIDGLLRELLIAVNDFSQRTELSPGQRSARFAALETLILQEINTGSKVPLALPWPGDERLRGLCAELLADPRQQPTLGRLADRLSVSERTLMRLFVKETSLTFRHWIQQMHVVSAAALLEEGLSVAQVARRLGYASAESFGNMFKRKTGLPPGRFTIRG